MKDEINECILYDETPVPKELVKEINLNLINLNKEIKELKKEILR